MTLSVALALQLIESSHEGVLIEDRNGRIAFANAAAAELLATTPKALEGQKLLSLVHARDKEALQAHYEACWRGADAGFRVEKRYRKRHGWLRVSVTVSAIRDAQGQITHLARFFHDASETVALRHSGADATAALARANATLTDAVSVMVALADNARDFIVQFDAHGRAVFANRSFEALFGGGGRLASPRRMFANGSRRVFAAAFSRVRRSGAAQLCTVTLLDAQGGQRMVEITIASAERREGKRAYVCIGHDVTHRDELERQLRSGVRDLERALSESRNAQAAEARFLSLLGHELRTPLTAVLGTFDVLSRENLPGDIAELCENARAEGEALNHHITDILDLVHARGGGESIKAAPVAPAAALAEAVTRAGKAYPGFKTGVEDCSLTRRLRNGSALRRVLLSLMAAGREWGAREIGLSAWDDGSAQIHLRAGLVPAPGRAMAAAVLGRDGPPPDAGRTGLRVLLAKALIEGSGGALTFENCAHGYLWRFAWPAETEAKDDGMWRARRAAERWPLNLLVVEDSPVIAQLITALVTSDGHGATLAASGEEAIAMHAQQRFDAILMDIQMPGIGGIAAMQRLRRQGFDRPIIATTAHALNGAAEGYARLGFDDFVPKPIDKAALNAALLRVRDGDMPRPADGLRRAISVHQETQSALAAAFDG